MSSGSFEFRFRHQNEGAAWHNNPMKMLKLDVMIHI
jgi:hypothetical protein